MPIPKRQHFIPILHLKHFVGAEPKGQVWTYDAEASATRSGAPANTAVQTHFYSIEGDDGAMDTRFEEHLASVENDAGPAYEALVRAEIPPKDSKARAAFAMFLALMHVRTPAMRRMAAEVEGRSIQSLNYAYGSNEQAFDTLLRRAEKNGARPLTAEEKDRLRNDLLDPSGYVLQIAQDRTLSVLGIADTLAPILSNMKWSLVEPLHGFFITSDNPLVRGVDPKTRHPIYGDGGFMNKTAEVIFPLSPHRLLLLSWDENARDLGGFERDHVDNINRRLAAHSDRYLYAHIHHKRLEQLAAEFKNSRPRMTTQGFGPKKFARVEVVRRMGDK